MYKYYKIMVGGCKGFCVLCPSLKYAPGAAYCTNMQADPRSILSTGLITKHVHLLLSLIHITLLYSFGIVKFT